MIVTLPLQHPGFSSTGIVPLNTKAGMTLLKNLPNAHNENMVNYFQSESQIMFSGPASLALLITAINAVFRINLSQYRYGTPEFNELLELLYAKKFIRMTESDVINISQVKKYLTQDKIDIAKDGLTLMQLSKISSLLKFGVNTYFADDNKLKLTTAKRIQLNGVVKSSGDKLQFKSLEQFREFFFTFFERTNKISAGIIVNYNRSVLGYESQLSVFSPVAAYNKEHDLILLMDVGLDGQPVWIKTEKLYKAMTTLDSKTMLPCGLVQIYELF